MFLPATLPARNGHTGQFVSPVSPETWIIGAVALAACVTASVFAFRGSRPDKVAASLAAVFIILLIVIYARALA
jgi:hypothetical protein